MTPQERIRIREIASAEAEKNQPDIWSDEYFPYWEEFYDQFEETAIARRIRESAEINPDDVRRLCELAEIGDEFDANGLEATFRKAEEILEI
ncbi:MAG: hypothetical protein IKO36_07280 [Bacteroidaceae bacterium]|nr:hypothetical protein [Bacteroidaceae bacterium]